jgi:hypothetical protein
VERREASKSLVAGGAERDPDHPVVLRVDLARDETCDLGALDQLDGAVVLEEQGLRDVVDGRAGRAVMPPHHEQELVLGRGDAGRARPGLAPVQEAPELRAQLEELAEQLLAEI